MSNLLVPSETRRHFWLTETHSSMGNAVPGSCAIKEEKSAFQAEQHVLVHQYLAVCCFFIFFVTKINVLYLAWLSCRCYKKKFSNLFPHISFVKLDLFCPAQPVLRWGTSFLCMSSRSLTFCRCGVFLNLTMCWNRRVSSMNGNQECLSSWHLRLSTVLPFYPGFFAGKSRFFFPFP